jgi:hypothetical protein
MASMIVTEDKPNKIILELNHSQSKSKPLTWNGCIRPSLLITIFLFFVLVGARLSFFEGSQSWLFWSITAGAILVAIFLVVVMVFFVSTYRNEAKEAHVTIDSDSQQAVRIEKLNSGKTKQYDLKFGQISQVLIHGDDLGHRLMLTLESPNSPSLDVNSDVFIDPQPMIELGRKLGRLIGKPVLYKVTDAGKPFSEEIVQP